MQVTPDQQLDHTLQQYYKKYINEIVKSMYNPSHSIAVSYVSWELKSYCSLTFIYLYSCILYCFAKSKQNSFGRLLELPVMHKTWKHISHSNNDDTYNSWARGTQVFNKQRIEIKYFTLHLLRIGNAWNTKRVWHQIAICSIFCEIIFEFNFFHE